MCDIFEIEITDYETIYSNWNDLQVSLKVIGNGTIR